MAVHFSPATQALIFDCDGTLVDSGAIHLQAWQTALEARRAPYDEHFLVACNGMPSADIIAEYNRRFNLALDADALEAHKNRLVAGNIHRVAPVPVVTEVLEAYYKQLYIAVFSGGRRFDVITALQASQLLEKVDCVVTAEDGFPPKNQPEAYTSLAGSLNIPVTACHFFEDGEKAIAAARSAGMPVTDVRQLSISDMLTDRSALAGGKQGS